LPTFGLGFEQGAEGRRDSLRRNGSCAGHIAAGAGTAASDAGGEEEYGLCPSPPKPCDPLYNPFSFDGTVVIYSTNALIQNMLDHGT